MHALLVDDHALFREGMRFMLRHLRPTAHIHLSANVPEAQQLLAQIGTVDLILLDLQLPGMQDLQALQAMRQFRDDLPIVVLSGNEDAATVSAAIDCGAMGFIRKSVNSDEMLTAVETVLAGGVYLPAPYLSAAPPASQSDSMLRQLGLSGRQAEVLVRLAQGKPNKTIAKELNISDTTVKSHVQSLFDVLDVHSRTQAVYVLARLGWRWTEVQ